METKSCVMLVVACIGHIIGVEHAPRCIFTGFGITAIARRLRVL